MLNELTNLHWELFLVRRGFESIQALFELIQDRGYIAGSYAAFMAAPYETPILPNDVDVFATSADHAQQIACDWLDKFGGTLDENEVVYSIQRSQGLPAIQVVKPHPQWQVFPEDILSSFDLDISRAVLVMPNTVVADANIGSRQGKVLRVNNPLRSLKRVLKYHDRGVVFSDHELLKLFQAWTQMATERQQELLRQAQPTPEDNDNEPPTYSFEWDDDEWFDGE